MQEPLKLRIFYFIMYSAFAAWVSFFNVHLDKIGYTGLQIGTLNALFISTSAFVVPFWGMLADKYGSNRILLLLTFCSAVIVFLIGKNDVYLFMMLLILSLSLFQQPMGAVMDGMTMGMVKNTGKFSYGQFRLWGSAGYAVTSLVVGFFAAKNTGVIFNIAAVLFAIVFLVNLITLPPKPVIGRGMVNFSSFSVFFNNKPLFLFLIIMFFYGIAVAPLHQFINLYYRDIGANSSLIGTAFFIQAAFEIPFFLIGIKLVRKIGAEKVIVLSMVITLVRLILYGFIHVPEYALFVGALHGFTISFFLVGVVDYVQNATPSHLRTTGQALIWAFHFGGGLTLGYICVGYLRDILGMHLVMHIEAVIALIMLSAVLIFFNKYNITDQNLNAQKKPIPLPNQIAEID